MRLKPKDRAAEILKHNREIAEQLLNENNYVISDTKPKIHELKVWEEFFWEVYTGNKPFEIRKNDKRFQVGDFVKLCEFHNETQEYGKHEIVAMISYILHGGQFGLEKGYVCLGLSFDKNHLLLLAEKKY